MTECKANERLIIRHNHYFTPHQGRRTEYAAVIKKSKDFSVCDDYIIEIAYKRGQTRYDDGLTIKNFIEMEREFDFSPELITDWYCDETDVIVSGEVEYLNDNSPSIEAYNELTGGISVYDKDSTQEYGTIGAFFKTTDNSTYLLSNYHVLLDTGGKLNDPIVHPSRADANTSSSKYKVIGEIYWKEDISEVGFNIMDAAIAKICDNINVSEYKYTRCNGIKFLSIGTPKIGQSIKKCGRSTGLTFGEIRSINATVNVSNNDNKFHLYKNQILTTYMKNEKGDSGSILVTEDGIVVGLLFARTKRRGSFANNINVIINKVIIDKPELKFNEFI